MRTHKPRRKEKKKQKHVHKHKLKYSKQAEHAELPGEVMVNFAAGI